MAVLDPSAGVVYVSSTADSSGHPDPAIAGPILIQSFMQYLFQGASSLLVLFSWCLRKLIACWTGVIITQVHIPQATLTNYNNIRLGADTCATCR